MPRARLHEFLFGHLDLLLAILRSFLKTAFATLCRSASEIALHGPSIEAAVGHTHNGNSA